MKNKIITTLIIIMILVSIFNISNAAVLEGNNSISINDEEISSQSEENTNENKLVKLEIINKDKQTNEPIKGSIFSILNEDYTVFKGNLVTDEQGKINLELQEGKYCLKQNSVSNNYGLNKGIIDIDLTKVDKVDIKIENDKINEEETTIKSKEINVIEEDKKIVQNNEKEVTNIKATNINKEIINTTKEINLNNVNNFINTINKKNIENLQKENKYENIIPEETIKDEKLEGENLELRMTRIDYINYMDLVMSNSVKVPILPVASK